MNRSERARTIVRDIERTAPYLFEGLYGSFLSRFMESDRSHWTRDLSAYLTNTNEDWADVSGEIALLLWEKFEQRISC
jgi:hypothetical protein